MPAIKRTLAEFGQARIGLNLMLWALEDAGVPWALKIGRATDTAPTPAESVREFLVHVLVHRHTLLDQLRLHGFAGLEAAAAHVADEDKRFLTGAATRNISFFVRYSLAQIQPTDDRHRQYDQGYLLAREDRRGERLAVQPGPSMLMLLVHCCSSAQGAVPASMEHFRNHLRAYGIGASADELRVGVTARDLERLGLVVDSPDAGGGRLLVDPFLVSES